MTILVYTLLSAWSLWIIICWLNGIRYRREFLRWKHEEQSKRPNHSDVPETVIWAAIKGKSDHFDDYLHRVMNQDHPGYKIVFSFESTQDPGHIYLVDALKSSPPRSKGLIDIQIVIAGESTDQGQKVHNLLAAYANDGGFGEVIAFIDSDVLWELSALRLLVEALNEKDVEQSTGYRWLVPSSQNMGSILASTISASISTLFGPRWRNSSWAGAMAISRHTFEKYDVANFWKGKLNDDVSVSRLIKSRGGKIAFCQGVTPLNWVDYSLHNCFTFGRRQYIQLWVFNPLLWLYAFAATACYCFAWLLCIFAIYFGYHLAWIAAAIVIVFDIALGIERRKIARLILPSEAMQQYRRVNICDTLLTPVWMTVHFMIVLSTVGARHISWGGIRYKITKDKTIICSRSTDNKSLKKSMH